MIMSSIIKDKTMNSIYKYISPIILITGSIVSIWFLIANLQPLQPASYVFVICIIIGLYLTVKVFNNNLIVAANRHILNITRRKHFVLVSILVITVVGLLARLFFYFKFSYNPASDPMTFYDAARAIAAGNGLQGDAYIALFPYLAAYDNILAVAMKLISDPWLATILLNTFFDIMSSLVVFILLKKLLKSGSQLPLIAFGVWMLSPLNIIFSLISIPVIVVNFFIILTILISYLLIQQVSKLKTKYALILSVILGVVIGYGNCFRPIFLVAVIALTVIFIIMLLTTNKSVRFLRLFIMCILLSLLIFMGIQKLNLTFVSNEIGLNAAKNPSGVSLYVGSNWETSGQWRPYINDEMGVICEKSLAQKKYDACHAELQSAAITRYKNYGILNSTFLFVSKLYHQVEQQNYLYNANQSIVGYMTSITSKVINIYLILYIIIVFTLSAKFLYLLAKQPMYDQVANTTLLFMALIMIGWFFSFMLAESAPRYSTILYPIFTVFSVLMLDNKTKSTSK